MIKGFSKPWISISLRFRDCGALRVMMESPVYQVSPVSQDLRDIRHTQEWVVHVNIHMYTYMLVATCTGRAGTGQITQNDCSHALETPVKPTLCCDVVILMHPDNLAADNTDWCNLNFLFICTYSPYWSMANTCRLNTVNLNQRVCASPAGPGVPDGWVVWWKNRTSRHAKWLQGKMM